MAVTSVAGGVHAQAARTPEALAVADPERNLNYAELDATAALLAERLAGQGIRAGDPVAVALPRGWRLVCAMLGVLRLGAELVPLDTASPAARRRHMLTDSGSVAVIHGDQPPEELPQPVRGIPVAELLGGPVPEPGPVPAPADSSFLFYTSGTTGNPKGVRVPDAGVLRLAEPGYIRLAAGMRFAWCANPAFDALSFEVWVPLLTGGTCVVFPDELVQTPRDLAEALVRERIDTLWMTSALFNAVVDAEPACFAHTGQLLIGGEQLSAETIRRWYANNPESRTQLYNGYGPTETSTFALSYPIPRDFADAVVPIGRPLPGTGTLLVHPDGERLAAPGEEAELYLSGAALAHGYRNLEAETARKFVRLPWHDGGRTRYYRTGDLVTRDTEGLLTYRGRTDRQVKVRGFRIEPGEVERQLLTEPRIRQAHVLAHRPAPDRPLELRAYLVADPELSSVDYQRHLSEQLPAFLRPHRSYLLDSVPRNANGKVDEAALEQAAVTELRAPVRAGGTGDGPVAEVLALAADLLGRAELRAEDGWIASGGDSLSALRLRFALRERFGREPSQAAVLRGSFRDIAEALAENPASGYPRATVSGAESGPATSEQHRLWLFQQRNPGSAAYNIGFRFRIRGTVDPSALRHALGGLVRRFPALRTGFRAGPGGLRQVHGEPYDPLIAEPEADFLERPFDLGTPRMFEAALIPEKDGAILLLRMHHIAVDGWSLNVLFTELSRAYAGAEPDDTRAPTPVDHAHWQSAWFGSAAYRGERTALLEHYANREPAGEPLAGGTSRARLRCTELDGAAVELIDARCAESGLTRFELLLAAFAVSLYAVTGMSRPRIAAPAANRPIAEFEHSVGMFANTVLLPAHVDPDLPLRELLARIGADTRAVLDRQDVAFADVLEAGIAGESPFDFLFVLENTDFGALRFSGCVTEPEWPAPAEAKCPMTVSVIEREHGLDCLWEYAEGAFAEAEVSALGAQFEAVLEAMGGRTSAAEFAAPYRARLPEPGRSPHPGRHGETIADRFAAQLARTPDAVALNAGGREVSYAELDAYACGLAGEILARHSIPDGPCHVALHCAPSVEHVVALLALARLNLTAVPLDPAYPPALLRDILDQTRPLCVLLGPGTERGIELGAVPGHPVRLVDTGTKVGPRYADRPLYTLFTSGSTGKPKGVRVPDRTLVNLLRWQEEHGGLGAPAHTQQFSMLSFDVSFQEIYATLCTGGTLHLVREELRTDLPALLEHLDTAGIERIHLPAVALRLLAEHGAYLGRYPARLRDVITAGEQLVCTEAVRDWFAGMPGARLHNHYGPTETHVVSALRLDGDPADWPERPAIGSPVAGTVLHVVDEGGQPLPAGRAGELLIGGLPAWHCYLGQEHRERFTELPGTGLCYRSGDLARFDEHGLLHYLGRMDKQVKLSGYRVELEQIDAALLRHPDITGAVAVADGDRLVACLRCAERVPDVASITEHLSGLLPDYLRVDRFRVLEELPRTPSGKLDREAALRAPGVELRRAAVAEPVSAREAELAAVFEAVTGRPIGPEQTFFEAGASSLALMRFQLLCATELGTRFTIAELFEHVTIRALARSMDTEPTETPAMEPESFSAGEPIAVIGMAVRLPGARDLGEFWELTTSGREGIEHFPAADGLVGARSQLDGPLEFDPARFGISPRDAELMDPQQRQLLLRCVEALAHAGIADPGQRSIGLIAGCGENTYFQRLLREVDDLPDEFAMAQHHDKDFLATKAAYHLGLTGPAFTAQSACSSSLLAVHLAAGLLRGGEAEVMLAGGVLVDPGLREGYRYRAQHIFSPDGHCRPFSADADGTVGGSGVGVVVLKPLRLARRDGDTVYSVLTGSAVNNDGAAKQSYSAPSAAGQREVIKTALRRSGRSGAEIGYVEAHGTGTRLGDPVEVGALRSALGITEGHGCALSSVKSQLGHLGAAAGVVGLIRATLAVHHGCLPPTPNFTGPGPELAADLAAFTVPVECLPWPENRPRIAAVSSFGIGGTNTHVVLESGDPVTPAQATPMLPVSANSAAAARAEAAAIADYLDVEPDSFPAVARHLQAGRPALRWRIAGHSAESLRTAEPVEVHPVAETVPGAASAAGLAEAWLAGKGIAANGPAPAPWNFPPPRFDLAEYDGVRPKSTVDDWPERLPESAWLHQPVWTRFRRTGTPRPRDRTLVLLSGQSIAEEVRGAFAEGYRRVVFARVAESFARLGADDYRVAADPESLRALCTALGDPEGEGIDLINALPLELRGPVDAAGLAQARIACLDSTAALYQAAPRLRMVWLSARAQAVDGPVRRPEAGLLAGAGVVPAQEGHGAGLWLDLPGAELTPAAATAIAALPGESGRLALRGRHWWKPETAPVRVGTERPGLSIPDGDHLVLGGTGGIGSAIAAWLLEQGEGRVLLLSRNPRLPESLRPFTGRVTLIHGDLAGADTGELAARIGGHTDRLATVVHAAGVAAGGLIRERDPDTARAATAANHGAALLTEELIAEHRPALALYCSSMSAEFGGAGQFDYAAAAGLLDGLAQQQSGDTERIGIDWDVWAESGMAVRARQGDARHRAHLAVGLTDAEGKRALANACALGFPRLLVCTTDLDEAPVFYAAQERSEPAAAESAAEPVELLRDQLCAALGIEELDPEAQLYELGADSLTMLELIDEVKRHLGVDIELSKLSHQVTLTELLATVTEALGGGQGTEDIAIEVWQQGSGDAALCLVHPVGGDIQAYRELVRALDPALTVCLIADPALRGVDGPEWTIGERAGRYHAALRARFPGTEWNWRFGGWSFGALVATEMAAKAEADGNPARSLHLFDPPSPEGGPEYAAYDEPQLRTLFARELGEETTSGYADRLAACCMANLRAMSTYRMPVLGATPVRMWFAERPVDGLPAKPEPWRQWQRWRVHLPEDSEWGGLDTDHYGIMRAPHVETLAGHIESRP
ncbi:non-ribosomal peptide synthetase [Sciscionella sediminilitoris]|uniref:non-ribosomal peptide synthetase n=1 Tax=Sciscionella sediminilitoris TaxID=1445613 RepID=UPI0004DF26AE|nr:non-ribosomal peptide synthetase [Sciscionella sp. SE31]